MLRGSKICLLVLFTLACAGTADATVSVTSASVPAGATGQSVLITWTARTSPAISGAGFDANVVENQNILVDSSITFQVKTGAGAWVNCDGISRTQSDFITSITCSPTGVYSIITGDTSAIPTLSNNMRVLYNVEGAAPAGGTATVSFGSYCTGIQAPSTNGCPAFFLPNATRNDAPSQPVTVNGTIAVTP